MKPFKNIYLFISTLLLVVGCSKADVIETNDKLTNDDTTSQEEEVAISFSSSSSFDSATKGVVIEDAASLATMGIYSYRTTEKWADVKSGDDVSTFFNDYSDTYPIMAEYNEASDSWSYGYTRYWPTDGTYLHFYAWAPYGRINRVFDQTSGRPIFNHTLSSDAIENYDLMWAQAQVDQSVETNSSGRVSINFEHALSRIALYARVMVNSVTSIEDDPTNIYAYERFGINGITFYDVVGKATVDYSTEEQTVTTTDNTISGVGESVTTTIPAWSPSWSLVTAEEYYYTRINLTASQGNTLLNHYNSIRTETGQVQKVSEAQVSEWEEALKAYGVDPDNFDLSNVDYTNPDFITLYTAAMSSYNNMMMTEDLDNDGVEETEHGIFMFPQRFYDDGVTAADSPDASMRVRIRHYSNYFISVAEAIAVIEDSGDDYLDYVYCNTDGLLAVIDFVNNTIQYIDKEHIFNYYTGYYDGVYYNANPTITDVNSEYYGELRYKCVRKDEEGDIYATGEILLSEVFYPNAGFVNGLEAGQYINLYFTFDLTENGDFDIPMTVTATVYDWYDVTVNQDVDDQLVIYCDVTQIESGSGTVEYYTVCEEKITINSVEAASGLTITAAETGDVLGSSTHQAHTFSYSGASTSTPASVKVTITKDNGQEVIKYFGFSVAVPLTITMPTSTTLTAQSGTINYTVECEESYTINSVTAVSGIKIDSATTGDESGTSTQSFSYSGLTHGVPAVVEVSITRANGVVEIEQYEFDVYFPITVSTNMTSISAINTTNNLTSGTIAINVTNNSGTTATISSVSGTGITVDSYSYSTSTGVCTVTYSATDYTASEATLAVVINGVTYDLSFDIINDLDIVAATSGNASLSTTSGNQTRTGTYYVTTSTYDVTITSVSGVVTTTSNNGNSSTANLTISSQNTGTISAPATNQSRTFTYSSLTSSNNSTKTVTMTITVTKNGQTITAQIVYSV